MTTDTAPGADQNAGTNDITELRSLLFATIRAVRDGTLELDRARVVNEIGKTLTDTARVEVEHLRVNPDAGNTRFLQAAGDGEEQQRPPAGVLSITRHVLGK